MGFSLHLFAEFFKFGIDDVKFIALCLEGFDFSVGDAESVSILEILFKPVDEHSDFGDLVGVGL